MPKTEPSKSQTCLNPSCNKSYAPGHYGKLQRVCSGTYLEKCSKKCPGKKCKKCAGAGKYKETCSNWYKRYWAKTRKPPRAMPENDQKKVLAYWEKQDFRYWALLIAARNSALRKGELLGITWADVEDGNEIRSNFPLRGQWDDRVGFKTTKTDTGRTAYFLKEVRQALSRLRKGEAKGDGPTDRIWTYTEVDAWKWWVRSQKKLGITNRDTGRTFRFHDLRHLAAIRTLKRTGKLHDVATLCGHSNLATSMIYTQQRPEDFVKSLE